MKTLIAILIMAGALQAQCFNHQAIVKRQKFVAVPVKTHAIQYVQPIAGVVQYPIYNNHYAYSVSAKAQQDALDRLLAQRLLAMLQTNPQQAQQQIASDQEVTAANIVAVRCGNCHGVTKHDGTANSNPAGGVYIDPNSISDAIYRQGLNHVIDGTMPRDSAGNAKPLADNEKAMFLEAWRKTQRSE